MGIRIREVARRNPKPSPHIYALSTWHTMLLNMYIHSLRPFFQTNISPQSHLSSMSSRYSDLFGHLHILCVTTEGGQVLRKLLLITEWVLVVRYKEHAIPSSQNWQPPMDHNQAINVTWRSRWETTTDRSNSPSTDWFEQRWTSYCIKDVVGSKRVCKLK